MDNWYSSPGLFRYLRDNETGAIGTLNRTRNGLPKPLRRKDRGDNARSFVATKLGPKIWWIHDAKDTIVMAWHDKSPVTMISAIGGTASFPKTRIAKEEKAKAKKDNPDPQNTDYCGKYRHQTIFKPQCILYYNRYMGGVDSVDQRRKTYPYPHKSKRWYMHLYAYFMDNFVINANITWNIVNPHRKKTAFDFRLLLVDEFVAFAARLRPDIWKERLTSSRVLWPPTMKSKPGSHTRDQVKNNSRYCARADCPDRTRRTHCKCSDARCNAWLHKECFGPYHENLFSTGRVGARPDMQPLDRRPSAPDPPSAT